MNQKIEKLAQSNNSNLLNSFVLGEIGINEFAQEILKLIKNKSNVQIEPLLEALFQSEFSPNIDLIQNIQTEIISARRYEKFIASLFNEKSNLKTIVGLATKKSALSILLGQAFSNVQIAAIILTSPKVPFAITQEIIMFYKLHDTKEAIFFGNQYPQIGNNSAKLLYEITTHPMNNVDAVALLTTRANQNPHDIFLKNLYKNSELSKNVCQFAEEHVFGNKANKDKYSFIKKEYDANFSEGKKINDTIKAAKDGDEFALANLIELASNSQIDSFEFLADFYNFINTQQNIQKFELTKNSKNQEPILVTLAKLDEMFLKLIFSKFNLLTSHSLKNELMDFARQKGLQSLFLNLPKEWTVGCKFTLKELGKTAPKEIEPTPEIKPEVKENLTNKNNNFNYSNDDNAPTEDELNSLFSNTRTWFKYAQATDQSKIDKLKQIVFNSIENEEINELIKTAGIVEKTKNTIFALCLIFCGITIREAAKQSSISENEIKDNLKKTSLVEKAREILRNNPFFNFGNETTEEEEETPMDARYENFLGDIRRHEGFRNRRYNCPNGFPTIGYGHRIRPNENLTFVTRNQAEQILNADATNAWNSASTLLAENVHPEAHPVVANMVFQMGLNGVRGFRNMLSALNRRDYALAADEMLDSQWARNDSPRRARELSRIIRNLQDEQD